MADSLLRQCQKRELELFDAFRTICEKHNLQYFLYGGTLLGAVRHGGFIPWDDDIDVAMPKKDYLKFLKIAPDELPETMLVTPNKAFPSVHAFAKLRDRNSFFCEKDTNVRLPAGIYIDIFPYEKIPKLNPRIGRPLAYWCYMAWISSLEHRRLVHFNAFGLFVSGIKVLVWCMICNSLRVTHRILACVCKTLWRCSPEVPLYQYHQGFDDKVMFPLSRVMFEGRECFAPHDVDAYLTQYYGNWRELPPEDKREWHASIICPTQAPDAPWACKYKA